MVLKTENKKIVAMYNYTDESGVLLYQNVRYTPKDFRQRRPDGNDGWHWNLNDCRRVLYRLSELLDPIHNRDAWVFFCEGEKDTDRLRELGLIATTSGNTNSWRAEFAEFLNDRHVAILPDNDVGGRKFARQVADEISRTGAEARIIELPGLAEGGDVSDWLGKGGNKDKLLALVSETKPFTLPAERIQTAFNLTDAGNGERFAAQHSDKMRYCCDWGKWLFYDKRRWSLKAGTEVANRLAVETARNILLEAEGKSYEQRGPILQWSYRSESKARLAAMLDCARWVVPVPAYLKDFDTDSWLLNCLNGTIDLRIGKLRPHNSRDMVTKLANVGFDENAKCPLWLECLETWMGGDEKKIDYLQRTLGMCLTGDICARAFPIFYGGGKNGKSSCLDTVTEIMGDYGSIGIENLLEQKTLPQHPCDIADLMGKRLIVVDETKENMKLRTALVKRMTGDRKLKGRFMRQNPFDFNTTHKTIMMTQHLPVITETSDAIWDRVHLLNWSIRISEEQQDPHLADKLQKEYSGILNWLVCGCIKWQQDGYILKPPESVESATQQYRQDSDPLGEFLEEYCDMAPNFFVPVTELRQMYVRWSNEAGVKHLLGPKHFSEKLRIKGCEIKTTRYENEVGTEKVARCWRGITLINNPRELEEVVTEPKAKPVEIMKEVLPF